MIHHDARPYAVATSEAAASFKTKLETMIHTSVARVERVIEQVQTEIPDDMIAAGTRLRFSSTERGIFLDDPNEGAANLGVHKHALHQLADRAQVKHFRSFVNGLMDVGGTKGSEWARELVAHNLNKLYAKNHERFLLRAVNGQLRGFLSSSYRRLDSRPLLDAFIGVVRKFGARPVDGFALETKMRVRAILPMVFEPFPGEIMAFGAELADSDFGDGALTLSGFVLRMWCTNLATTEDVLTKVHLGKRMTDVRLSEQTYQLDTQTMTSAVNDLSSHVLGAGAVNGYLDMVRSANEAKVDPKQIDGWIKKNLGTTEGDRAKEKFASADVEMLPAGQTKWRWSNAISWLANETEDERRKLELQDLAGGLLKAA